MGCNNSKQTQVAQPQAPPKAAPKMESAVNESVVVQQTAIGDVEVYGVPPSMNCMGAVLLTSASKCGKMVPCMPGEGTKTAEFVAMNPFKGVPTLKDKEFTMGESSSILRYLAEKYAPDTYPKGDMQRRGFIDWAMDHFASTMVGDVVKTVYPCLGFAPAPADPKAAGKLCTEHLETFAKVFLKDKFVGGKTASIADYKVAPFFLAFSHQMLKEKCFVEIPARLQQFNKDFADSCPAYELLLKNNEMSVKEILDSKYGKTVPMISSPTGFTESASDAITGWFSTVANALNLDGKGKVSIYGVPVSMNCAGAVMLAKHASIGDMVVTAPGPETKTEDFLAMNPFHAVPTLKDGHFCMAESNAILRYMAQTYAPEYYPDDAQKRGFINWAMDRFSTGMYNDAVKTIYVALGFMAEPESSDELEAAGKAASDHLSEFAAFFLKTKFVGGETLSIADFKVAPFFFAYTHSLMTSKFSIQVPERIVKFVDDFMAACPSSSLLQDAGGMSLKEMLDHKANPAIKSTEQEEQLQQAMTETTELVPTQVAEVDVRENPGGLCGSWCGAQ